MKHLYSIKIREIWNFIRGEAAAFWFICAYLFFEYVRPQTIYPVIDILPYAQVTLVLAGIALLRDRNSTRTRSPVNALLLLYLLLVTLSSALAYSPTVSFSNLPLFLSWVLIYFLITNIVNTENRFLCFMLSFLLYNFKMAQHAAIGWAKGGFEYRFWGVVGAPGWFYNSGEFGIEMCIFLPLSIYFIIALKRYWPPWKTAFFLLFPLSAIVGVMGSASRGAQLGMFAVVLWMLLKSKHRVKTLLGALIVGFFVLQALPPSQMERFHSAGEDKTSRARLTYWKDGIEITNNHPILGIGYANWSPYYRRYYNPRGEFPHNIFIQASAELGYSGLLVFVSMIIITFVVNRNTRKLAVQEDSFIHKMAHGLDAALIGYLVGGFFVTVLYYPFFWINLAMTVALHNVAARGQAKTVSRNLENTNLVSVGEPVSGLDR